MPYFLGIPTVGNQNNVVTLVQDAYKKTIMISLNHPWLLQKTVLLAIHTTFRTSTRESLYRKIFGASQNDESRKPLEENLYKAINSMKKVYDIIEKLNVEKELPYQLIDLGKRFRFQ